MANEHVAATKQVFTVGTSPEGLPAISIEHPSADLRSMVRNRIMRNHGSDPVYWLKNNAGAFLQCDHESYILVEFWKRDYAPFVAYLNEEADKLRKAGNAPDA